MNQPDISTLNDFVNINIEKFHNNKLKTLSDINLKNILKNKNDILTWLYEGCRSKLLVPVGW